MGANATLDISGTIARTARSGVLDEPPSGGDSESTEAANE
jgi:hypothetical protein